MAAIWSAGTGRPIKYPWISSQRGSSQSSCSRVSTLAAEDNTIARIIKLVEEAETARAPTERFIDRFSFCYMPAIVVVALLVALLPPLALGQDWGTWVYRALALLLIGCPCALAISVLSGDMTN